MFSKQNFSQRQMQIVVKHAFPQGATAFALGPILIALPSRKPVRDPWITPEELDAIFAPIEEPLAPAPVLSEQWGGPAEK